MPPPPLSPTELRALLVTIIAGATDGDEARWEKLVGPVDRLNIVFNIHSNWSVKVAGTKEECRVINRAIEIVRGEEPYVG
jgi:hypothetical protein